MTESQEPTFVLFERDGAAHLLRYDDAERAAEDALEVNTFLSRAGLTGAARVLSPQDADPPLIDLVPESDAPARTLEAAGWRREDGRWSSHQGEHGEGHTLNDALLQLAYDRAVGPVQDAAGRLVLTTYGPSAATLNLHGTLTGGTLHLSHFDVLTEDDRALRPLKGTKASPALTHAMHALFHAVVQAERQEAQVVTPDAPYQPRALTWVFAVPVPDA